MTRRLLLLQGPVGGFFGFLQNHLRSEGFEARRLVFNGGDIAYALGSPYEIVRFGTESHAAFFDRLLAEWRPDAIVLFGDERPVHRAARKCAEEAGIPVWCFEEGYIRPDHVTFEKGGNNANSSLRARFDPTVVPPTVAAAPRLFGQTVAMGLRAWGYFVAHRISRRLFPGYTHHRERRLRDEFRFWIRSAWRRAMSHRHDRALVAEIVAGLHPPFFIVALQVHDDMQLRVHGRGWKTMSFVEMVLESFRRAAPAEARLVIKAHPLDVGHGHNKKNIRLLIEKYGLAARVEFLQSGPLLPIVRHARGLVTINSTAGIAALRNHIPVIAFGEALYHLEGLSRRPDGVEDLDRFWIAPPEVDVVRAWRFGEHVMHEVLLPGSYYLPATWPALAARVTERLIRGLDPPVAPPIGEPTTALPVPPPGPAPSHRPRVGIASGGVWRRRESVARLLDAEPVRIGPWSTRGCDLLAGWGHKATTRRIRARAAAADLPYVAIEDGFLRSVRPGADEVAIGWIVDRSGVYYDTLRPNDFEAAVVRRAAAVEADHGEIRSALDAIRDLRLSKYNHAPMRTAAEMGLPAGRDVVLVVDQTFGDASIGGAAADGASFVRMLDAAIAENPGAPIAVKIHPEAISGTKRGYLAEVARRRGVIIVGVDVNPWALIETARRVYTVSSQFGMEALLAGVPVTSFGAAFYAGWGLTDDRFAPSRRRTVAASREALAEAAYVDYCRWLDPWDGRPIDLASAIDRLAFLRDRFHENTASVCVGFSRWKRRSTRRFLAGIGGEPRFVGDEKTATAVAEASGARIVVWGNRAFADASRPVVRAEDGFLRSVGLGAAFVAPASLVFDAEGMYYDPRRACGFETLATETTFGPDLVARAARLRETIVAQRLSKYNESGERRLDFPPGAIRILVPGQVEDDASVRFGSPMVPSNLELLRRVRARWPAAHILYKPHPDVHAGYRAGAIPEAEALRHADRIVTDVSMPSLLAQVDRVETMTSLTGFEALLRGLPVATHGIPFYAGWGLCEDLAPCERRRRRLALDELVAVALILYPRYIDPATGLPAPVEVVVERLIHGREAGESPLGRLTRRLRHRYAWVAHNVLGPLVGLFRRP